MTGRRRMKGIGVVQAAARLSRVPPVMRSSSSLSLRVIGR